MLMKRFRWILLPLKLKMLAFACGRLNKLPLGAQPSRFDIAMLAMAWGNAGYAGGVSYLGYIGQRLANTQGSILECGSGATTLLMAALSQNQGNEFIVLEHNRVWYHYMRKVLQGLGYSHVRLIHAPLKQYGHYQWYQISTEQMPRNIGLVICDGPPGSIKGGRYGLMPVMEPYLARNCIILLDDTHRKAERKIIELWRRYRPLTANRIGRRGSHTEVIFS